MAGPSFQRAVLRPLAASDARRAAWITNLRRRVPPARAAERVLKTTSTAVAPPCSSGSRGVAIGIVQLVAPAALTEVNDADLARALIGGHPDAPRAIWIRFAPLVRRLVRRSLGPDQGVEDLVQDVFASLFEKPQRLREPAAFRSFLMSITLN